MTSMGGSINTTRGSSSGSKASKPIRRHRSLLIAGLICSNILVFVLSGYSLNQSRQQYQQRAEALTQTIAQALDQNLSSSIEKIDLALRTVADELERQLADGGISESKMNAFLARQEQRLPETEAFRVSNADGLVILGKGLDKSQGLAWADREYFIYHRDHDDRALQISKPRMGRVAKQYIVGFAQRYNYPDGRFAGVISAPIAVSHFTKILSRFDLGPHGTIVLRDKDLGLITRIPAIADQPAGQIGNSTVSREFRQLHESGQTAASYLTQSGFDGLQRIVTFRRLEKAPMIAITAAATKYHLADWWQEVYKTLSMALGFLVVSLLLGIFQLRLLLREEKHLQTLAEREAQLQTLISAVPDSIQFKDGQGRWLIANNVCQEIFGLTDLAWHGLTDRQIIDLQPAMAEALIACQDSDEATWAAGQICRSEEQLDDVRGERIHFDVIKVPLFDEAHERLALVIVSRDITRRQENEAELVHYRHHLEELVEERTSALLETEARASHILQSSADGLYGVDRDGIITFINPAASAILGYQDSEVIGRSGHATFHHSRPDGSPYPYAECPSHKAICSGQRIRIDNEVYWHADGHAIPVMYAVHPTLQNGRHTGAVVSFVDMSAQQAATRAREQALNAAENLARIRSEFLANMSHEIRTPLNGILGFAEIGFRNHQNSERARDAFAKIQASGKRLLGVINDVLDFSKIEAGKLGIEQTDVCLREVVDHAIDLVRDRGEAKQLALQVELAPDLPGQCTSDPLRMGQVLLNLLSNAVKFTEAGSVRLSLSRQGNWLVFRIEDTGIGMTGEQLDKLFNPFQQADASASRRFGGTGLGLAISKRIVELMGGRIHLDSTVGKGTTAEFRLPYLARRFAPPAPLQTSLAPNRPLAGISILAAEDEPINRTLLEENLLDDGARVVVVSNGREAVERLIHDGPAAYDIVLMDIQMPEMDGYEASRRILELAPELPIIAQTAHAFAEEKEKCLAAGMLDHIAKPINPQELQAVILRHVSAKRSAFTVL
ncbi:MAG: ATP-binding protein [Azonexus sp.]